MSTTSQPAYPVTTPIGGQNSVVSVVVGSVDSSGNFVAASAAAGLPIYGGGGGGSSLADVLLTDTNGILFVARDTGATTGTIFTFYRLDTQTVYTPIGTIKSVDNALLSAISTNTTNVATATLQTSGNASLTTIAASPFVATAVVKAASTAPVATDPALVVSVSPNSTVTVTGAVSTTAPTDTSTTGTITTQNLNLTGVATAGSAVTTGTLNGAGIIGVQVTGTGTGTLAAQISFDGGTTWQSTQVAPVANVGVPASSFSAATIAAYWVNALAGAMLRITATTAVTGTIGISIRSSVTAPSSFGLRSSTDLTSISGANVAPASGNGAVINGLMVGVLGASPNTDYSAQSVAAISGSLANISDTNGAGAVCSFDINLSTFTAGSSIGLDIFLQWSPDAGTTWYDIWQCEALTAAGHVFIPALMMPGSRRRIRWVNRGGAATTATLTVIANRLSVMPMPVRQWFDRSTAVLQGTPVLSSTAAYDIVGCKNLVALVTISALVTTGAAYQIQVSADGTNWGYVGSPVTAIVGTISIIATGIAGRFARVTVQTAETGGAQTGTVIALLGSN